MALGLSSLALAIRSAHAQSSLDIDVLMWVWFGFKLDLELRAGTGPIAVLRGENTTSRYNPSRFTTTLTVPPDADRIFVRGSVHAPHNGITQLDGSVALVDITACMQHLRDTTNDFGNGVARFAAAYNTLPLVNSQRLKLTLARPAQQNAITAATRRTGIALANDHRAFLRRTDGLVTRGGHGFLPASGLERTDLWLRRTQRAYAPPHFTPAQANLAQRSVVVYQQQGDGHRGLIYAPEPAPRFYWVHAHTGSPHLLTQPGSDAPVTSFRQAFMQMVSADCLSRRNIPVIDRSNPHMLFRFTPQWPPQDFLYETEILFQFGSMYQRLPGMYE